jgi:hypothetical protein
MDLTKEQRVCIKFCTNLGHSCPGLSLVTRAGFTVTILRQSNKPPNGKVQTPRPKKVRQVKSEVKSMHIISFDIKGIVHNEFVLEGQRVNSAY